MDFLSQLVRYIALFGIWDLVDIAIVAYIAYRLIVFSRRSNAGQVVKGIVFLLLVTQLSNVLGLNLLNFLLRNIIQIGFIAVVILTIIFAKKYFEKKNVLTLYEKTFGLINDEEYDLSVYQSYLDEDN